MSNLVSTEFRLALLSSYFKGVAAPTTHYLHLFKDEANIVEATTMSEIAAFAQSGSGYVVKPLVIADWTVEAITGAIRARIADQSWAISADNWGTLRWGVVSDKADFSGKILLARDYGLGRNVTGVGSSVTVDDLSFQIAD